MFARKFDRGSITVEEWTRIVIGSSIREIGGKDDNSSKPQQQHNKIKEDDDDGNDEPSLRDRGTVDSKKRRIDELGGVLDHTDTYRYKYDKKEDEEEEGEIESW